MPALRSLVYQSLAPLVILAIREHRLAFKQHAVGEQAILHRPVLDFSSKDRKQTQSDFPYSYLVPQVTVI
ncbi:MAG: hypothetical protein MI746_16275 [Pseudomonadales bacterium]|nr:hypothetical protein [Pseudomonadales bacterium]